MNVEYPLKNEVKMKITFATDLEGDPAEIAKEMPVCYAQHESREASRSRAASSSRDTLRARALHDDKYAKYKQRETNT